MKRSMVVAVAMAALFGLGVSEVSISDSFGKGYRDGYYSSRHSWYNGYNSARRRAERSFYMDRRVDPSMLNFYDQTCTTPRCVEEFVEGSIERLDEWCAKFPMICESKTAEEVFNYAR